MRHMSCRKTEQHGISIIFQYTGNTLQKCAAHTTIVLAIGKLPDNHSANHIQHTAQTQLMHHTVDLVMLLGYILDEQDSTFALFAIMLDSQTDIVWGAAQAAQYSHVPAAQNAANLTFLIQQRTLNCILASLSAQHSL